MIKHTITQTIKTDIAMAPVAAGTTDTQTGITIDTLGYESVVFLVYFGAITANAVTTIKIQADSDSAMGTVADVAGSSISVPVAGASKGWLSVEIHRPTKRYLRVAVTRATANAVINGAIVMLGRAGVQPPEIGVTMGNSSPAVLVSVP